MSDIAPRQSQLNLYPRSIVSSSGSSLNPEVERDHYREKVEHFRILVQKLQEENQVYKLKKESTETVSRLLQESKQEVASLQKKCSLQDATIRTLQSRLETHGLSSDILPHEGEQYLPGPSKTVLDNLTRENKRLRNLVKSKAGDPEQYAKLQQKCEELEKDCSELRLLLNNQEARCVELERLLRGSDNEKDKTINELRENLNHLQGELTSRNNLCATLSEETKMLQKQLEDVARQFQELAKRLQEYGQAPDHIVPKKLKSFVREGSKMSTSVDEVSALKQRLKEITDMNKRWQEYNNQRDAYVKTLLGENTELRQRLSETEGSHVPPDVQVEMNKILDEARRLSRAKEEQKQHAARACSERDRIKKEFESVSKEVTSLRAENQQLKRQLQSGKTLDCTETIDALKAQIRICTEDFESERKDRERAQSKIVRLENEISRLKKEIESYKREPSRWQASPITPYTDPFYHQNIIGSSNEALAARGVSRFPDQTTESNRDRLNVIDSKNSAANTNNVNMLNAQEDKEQTFVVRSKHIPIPVPKPKPNEPKDPYLSLNTSSMSSKESPLSITPPTNSRGNSPLQRDLPNVIKEPLLCPKCNKEFSSTQHPELLDHIEHCAN